MTASSQRAETSALVGTWVFVLSDALGFAALLSTMAALRAGSAAPAGASFADGAAPSLSAGLAASAILAGISACLVLARSLSSQARRLGALAMLLALAFCALQLVEYRALLGESFAPATPAQESFVVATGYHLLHVFCGGLALAWGLVREKFPLGPLSIYWHFVDALWLFLFVFFYLL